MPQHCFECEKGRLVEIIQDYTDVGPDGAAVVVPGVKMLRCTDCGEELIPAESNRYISRYVAEANEQLTKAQFDAKFADAAQTVLDLINKNSEENGDFSRQPKLKR